MGIDFRDAGLILNAGNSRKISAGMIFNLAVGFEKLERKANVKDEKLRTYALLIADTVLVTQKEAVLLTKSSIEFSEISYQMEGDEEVDLKDVADIAAKHFDGDFGPRTRGSRGRRQQDEEASAAAEKRKEEQIQLAERRRQQKIKELTSSLVSQHFDSKRERSGVICSYSDVSKFPDDSKPNQLYVDVPNESILVPINGQLVPFHVDLIKNVSKTEQADFTVLRLNFITPDIQSNTLKVPPYADRNAVYVRELSYKSKNPQNLNKVLRLIKELQKRIKQRETEKAEESSMVVQADLALHRDKKIVPRLRDLQVRPKLPGKKKNTGTLEAHINGFRFVSANGFKIDILYSNVKHAFFQPCEGTVSVILHFELRHPIKIDKKRTSVSAPVLSIIL
jgi:nucleosome binding factor SPN SPT16 subunit